MKNILLINIFLFSFIVKVFSQVTGESSFKYIYISKVPKPTAPAKLEVTDIIFDDHLGNKNKALDANEIGMIYFTVTNSGKGDAYALNVSSKDVMQNNGLKIKNPLSYDKLAAGSSGRFSIEIEGSSELQNGEVDLLINVLEGNGFDTDPVSIKFKTFKFKNPDLVLASHKFTNKEGEGKVKLGEMVNLQLLIQNKGQGVANDLVVDFTNPEKVFPGNETSYKFSSLQPNETFLISYDFFANNQYKQLEIPIEINVRENYGKYGFKTTLKISLDQILTKTTTVDVVADVSKDVKIEEASLFADIDQNIPQNIAKNPNKYAIIIGNEDYSSRQNGIGSEVNVPYAVNDARVFKDYASKTFGVKNENIYFLSNATAGEMNQKIMLVSQILNKLNGQGELIFYYAGHGYPDEISKEPYLIPVDVNASNLSNGVRLYEMYKRFLDANPKKVTVFLDACFSGGGRDAGLLAARAVKIKPKQELIQGNIVVFSATSEEQTALPYKAKQHGMYTYFLLKKIQESKGLVSYGDLYQFLTSNVSIESLRINNKAQDPQVLFGNEVFNTWKDWKVNE